MPSTSFWSSRFSLPAACAPASVLGMCALRNSKEWSDRDIEKALSPEALTAAVMQRYHIIASTKDVLRRTLRGLPIAKKQTVAKATPRKPNYQQLDVAAKRSFRGQLVNSPSPSIGSH